jgi:hypothetical protein
MKKRPKMNNDKWKVHNPFIVLVCSICLLHCSTLIKTTHNKARASKVEIVGPDPDPQYPDFAFKHHITGSTDILFEIDQYGDANSFTVLNENPKGFKFASAAINQIRSTKYRIVSFNEGDKPKIKRHFAFSLPDSSERNGAKIDTVTYKYSDNHLNKYIVKMESGSGAIFLVYDSSGVQLEAGYYKGGDTLGFTYVRDASSYASYQILSGFNFGIAGCGERSDGKSLCKRDDDEIKEYTTSQVRENSKIYWKYFNDSDFVSKNIQIQLMVNPSGEIERLILRSSKSGNVPFTLETIGMVNRWRFRRISGSLHQLIDIGFVK